MIEAIKAIDRIIDTEADCPVEDELDGNNLIPSWSRVGDKFKLNEILSPSEQRLTQDYYRAQKRIAEGRQKKAQNIFEGLDKNTHFVEFEKRENTLLTDIAKFIRGRSEKIIKLKKLG